MVIVSTLYYLESEAEKDRELIGAYIHCRDGGVAGDEDDEVREEYNVAGDRIKE